MSYFGKFYRFRRWFLRYLRWADLLGLLIGLLGSILAVLAYSQYQTATLYLGSTYALVFVFRFIQITKSRRARDTVQANVYWQICYQIDRHIVDSELGARITLFCSDPFRPTYIIPRYRYRRGLDNPIIEAAKSRARYKFDEGITGAAWAQPGSLYVGIFPRFDTRSELEAYYRDRIRISHDIVSDLSDYMERVRTILSYGLEDAYGRFL